MQLKIRLVPMTLGRRDFLKAILTAATVSLLAGKLSLV
ncbi:MAG: hypothetical protein DRO52_04250, partial [Candidatus Hecatellales archaeon]